MTIPTPDNTSLLIALAILAAGHIWPWLKGALGQPSPVARPAFVPVQQPAAVSATGVTDEEYAKAMAVIKARANARVMADLAAVLSMGPVS